MEKNSFSFARLGMVMKKQLIENGRGLTLKTALVFGVAILAGISVAWGHLEDYDGDWAVKFVYNVEKVPVDVAWGDLAAVYYCLIIIFTTIAASMVGSGLGSKESRMREITLPASQSEKFLARWLVFVPAATLLIFVSLLIAELVRVGVTTLLVKHSEHVLFMPPSHILFDSDGSWSYDFILLAMLFVIFQSLACLGGMLWHKSAYVKTALFAGAISMLYLAIGALTVRVVNGIDITFFNSIGRHTFFVIMGVFTAVIFLYCHTTAYFRYKEMEIHEHW